MWCVSHVARCEARAIRPGDRAVALVLHSSLPRSHWCLGGSLFILMATRVVWWTGCVHQRSKKARRRLASVVLIRGVCYAGMGMTADGEGGRSALMVLSSIFTFGLFPSFCCLVSAFQRDNLTSFVLILPFSASASASFPRVLRAGPRVGSKILVNIDKQINITRTRMHAHAADETRVPYLAETQQNKKSNNNHTVGHPVHLQDGSFMDKFVSMFTISPQSSPASSPQRCAQNYIYTYISSVFPLINLGRDCCWYLRFRGLSRFRLSRYIVLSYSRNVVVLQIRT